jgi:hypothetical protein
VLALLAGAPAAAGAATAAPGMLDKNDLPSGFLPVAPDSTVSAPAVLVTDGTSCTQRLQPVAGAVDGSLAQFTPSGAANALPSVTELVLRYTDTGAAASSFGQRRASHAARVKCATVQLLPAGTPGPASPTTTIQYAKAKIRFAGLGRDWFAERSAQSGTIPYTALTFRSGPYVVGLTFSAGPAALDAKTLRKIAVTARRRLRSPVSGP